jgi:hypothetical protein
MREFKFRFWFDSWFYGKHMNYRSSEENKHDINIETYLSHNENTMQYTWIKDRNWKEIYEWDILEWLCWVLFEVYYEFWDKYMSWIWFDLRVIKEHDKEPCIDTSDMKTARTIRQRCKIIWNIYENPELLSS